MSQPTRGGLARARYLVKISLLALIPARSRSFCYRSVKICKLSQRKRPAPILQTSPAPAPALHTFHSPHVQALWYADTRLHSLPDSPRKTVPCTPTHRKDKPLSSPIPPRHLNAVLSGGSPEPLRALFRQRAADPIVHLIMDIPGEAHEIPRLPLILRELLPREYVVHRSRLHPLSVPSGRLAHIPISTQHSGAQPFPSLCPIERVGDLVLHSASKTTPARWLMPRGLCGEERGDIERRRSV